MPGFFSRSADAMRVLNLMSFFMCSPIVDKVGLGFCPKTVRKAGSGVAADQTNAMLALPLREDFSAAAWILCATPGLARTLAQRGALWHSCAHIRSRGAKPHTAATRASRRGAGSLPAGRVDRVDVSHGGKIGTIGPFQANQPLSVALSERYQNAVFP